MVRADWTIEVVYGAPAPDVRWVRVAPGSTVLDAIRRSGLLEAHPEVDMRRRAVGIFGRPVTLSEPVRAFDRVEIYAPLPEDPKEARRRRASLRRATSRKCGGESGGASPRSVRACRS